MIEQEAILGAGSISPGNWTFDGLEAVEPATMACVFGET